MIYSLKSRMSKLIEELNIDVNAPNSKLSFFTNTFNLANNEVRENYIDEYYGNYTHEVIYAINIKDLLKLMITKEEFEVLLSCLYDLILEKKPELLEEDNKNSRKFK